MQVYRMHRAARAAGDYTGAMLAGGRWNSIGAPMLYTARYLSLACIEVLVHLDKSQLQGFRGVVCSVREASRLRSVLSAESSLAHQAVTHARAVLIHEIRGALGELHWKDFETLVDLLFRNAGWRWLSLLGETMKFADLELEEPINHERYQVQIKAKADSRVELHPVRCRGRLPE